MRTESFGSVKIFWPLYSREVLIEKLREYIPALSKSLPLERVVLFGSWAQGRATVRSDIDLLVVYRGDPRDDAYSTVRRAFDIRGIEAHVYTQQEAKQVQSTIDRMIEGGVVLFSQSRPSYIPLKN